MFQAGNIACRVMGPFNAGRIGGVVLMQKPALRYVVISCPRAFDTGKAKHTVLRRRGGVIVVSSPIVFPETSCYLLHVSVLLVSSFTPSRRLVGSHAIVTCFTTC